MRKIKYFLTMLCLGFFGCVNAADISVSISCPNSVYVGEYIVCKINSNISEGFLSGIKANYALENGSFVSFAGGSSWVVYANTPSGFVLGNTSGGVTNNTNLGNLTIKPSGGAGTNVVIKLNAINASDVEYNDYDLADKSISISIKEKEVVKEPETPSVAPKKEEVFLDNLIIEGYSISFDKNVYEYSIDVEKNVNVINVKAISKNNKVTGDGNLALDQDENVFKIIVKGKESSKTYTLIVRKSEDVSENSTNNVDSVEKSLGKYDTVYINLDKNNDELIAYQNILDKIKGQNKNIVYNIYSGEILLYSYVFDGSKMDFVLDNMNLQIDFNADKIDNKKNLILNMNYKSYFPKGTLLKIYNVKPSKKDMKLYRINDDEGWELIKSKVDLKDNTFSLSIEKGDLYVVANATSEPNYSFIIITQSIVIIIAVIESIFVTYKYVKIKLKS